MKTNQWSVIKATLIISYRDFRQSKQLAVSVSQTFVKLQNTLVLVTELLGWVY